MKGRPHHDTLLTALLLCIGSSIVACRSECKKPRSDTPVEKKPSLSDDIAAALGDRWKIFSQDGNWVVERKDLPKTYNMISPNPHDMRRLTRTQDTEVRERIFEKYRVNVPYRIVIRKGPRLDAAEVARRLHANPRIPQKLSALEADGIFHNYKMTVEAQSRLQKAWETAEEIPCGTYRQHTIYLYLTNLGGLDTKPTAHKDYYIAALSIASLLTPYEAVRLRRGPKDPKRWSAPDRDGDCPYNPLARLKSVACLW